MEKQIIFREPQNRRLVAWLALLCCASVGWAAPPTSPAKTFVEGLTSTVLSEVDTTYTEADVPAITGQALPAGLPPGRYTSRVSPKILGMNDDGATLAWMVSLPVSPPNHSRRHEWLIVNGKAGARFDLIDQEMVVISADGKHVAYAGGTGQRGSDARWSMVLDGAVGRRYRSIWRPVFSPDGNHLAYGVTREDHAMCKVVDGQEYQTLSHSTPVVFSPDSSHWAFACMTPAGAAGWSLVLDGKQIAGDVRVLRPSSLVFSPDGKRLALRLQQQDQRNRILYMVHVDGAIGEPSHDVLDGSLRFSDDSTRLVYVAGNAKNEYCVIDNGQPGQPFNFIFPSTVTFASGRLAFVAGTGQRDGSRFVGSASRDRNIPAGQPTLIVDGKPLAHPAMPQPPVFSRNGKRLAYFGQLPHPEGGLVPAVIVDGKADPPANNITHLQFSPSGNHYAYTAADSSGAGWGNLVIDGAPHRLLDCAILRMTLDDAGQITAVINDTHGIYRRVRLGKGSP